MCSFQISLRLAGGLPPDGSSISYFILPISDIEVYRPGCFAFKEEKLKSCPLEPGPEIASPNATAEGAGKRTFGGSDPLGECLSIRSCQRPYHKQKLVLRVQRVYACWNFIIKVSGTEASPSDIIRSQSFGDILFCYPVSGKIDS
jgi:hypothetical protein